MTLEANAKRYYAAMDLGRKAEGAIYGTRGAPKKREFIQARVKAIGLLLDISAVSPKTATQKDWEADRLQRRGLGLAREAGMRFDEHGSTRGDYRSTHVLDYVPPAKSKAAPFLDMGNAGLALVEITRKRVYAKSSNWYPHTSASRFLVGRNEAGTFFSHAVPEWCGTVEGAIDWIWSGKSSDLVMRQGDIAIVMGSGRKMPKLPDGHRVEGDRIVHATHPAIRLPKKGERVIVGRRAEPRVVRETRD